MDLKAVLKPKITHTLLNPFYIARNGIRRRLTQARPFIRGRLLDIGCGQKPYAELFTVRQYVGVELPATLSNSRVIDVYASGLALPFGPEIFDSVLSTEVLEHVPEPKRLFSEAARVLRPGGYLVLSTPQTWGLHEVPYDFYRYTPYGLRYLAEMTGFQVIESWPTCGLWAMIGQRISSFLIHRYGKRRGLPVQALIALMCAVIQIVALTLDWLFREEGDTLDNVIVAQKKKDEELTTRSRWSE